MVNQSYASEINKLNETSRDNSFDQKNLNESKAHQNPTFNELPVIN